MAAVPALVTANPGAAGRAGPALNIGNDTVAAALLVTAAKMAAEDPRQRPHERGEHDRVRRPLARVEHVGRTACHRLAADLGRISHENQAIVGIDLRSRG